MNTKTTFDQVSVAASKLATCTYSTSFSLGIHCLNKRFHAPLYSIYGFVRFADEIVDTFHEFDKETLINEFEEQTYTAIERRISLNPILNSFQDVVHKYSISNELIDAFLKSMKCDLDQSRHDTLSYKDYIFGSAEVVGLMCLKVFTEGNNALYEQLQPSAMKLGSAFQKVNFLRDIKSDYAHLGRIYFPGVDITAMTKEEKVLIEKEIERDFSEALEGIKRLPRGAGFGVYVAYVYYKQLFQKIKSVPPARILAVRIRIPDYQKIGLLFSSYFRHAFRLI